MKTKTYTMKVTTRSGDESVVLVRHNKLDIKVLVGKAILESEFEIADVLHCHTWRV